MNPMVTSTYINKYIGGYLQWIDHVNIEYISRD